MTGKRLNSSWREVPDYPAYAVNEYGDVIRLLSGHCRVAGQEVAGSITAQGYRTYRLMLPSGKKGLPVFAHRLVALAFLGPPPSPNHEIAHWDGNRLNNHVDNLRWSTRKENAADTIRHGTSSRGTSSSSAKLNPYQVAAIRLQYVTGRITTRELSKQFGVSQSHISRILNNKAWM